MKGAERQQAYSTVVGVGKREMRKWQQCFAQSAKAKLGTPEKDRLVRTVDWLEDSANT